MQQPPVLTVEMAIVFAIVALAVVLFATGWLRVDVTALAVLAVLGLLTFVPGVEPLLPPDVLFAGLSSNAVVALIAVMIMGGGLEKTGVMEELAGVLLRYGGRTERRVMTVVSGTAAVVSSVVQNVGAAALVLPVTSRMAARARVPMARLVMPMGFCTILGGTLTMIGSSPLIMLNDLLDHANESLAPAQAIEHFELFAVTPVGLALVVSGIAYFVFVGRTLLPRGQVRAGRGAGTVRYLRRLHGIDAAIREIEVPPGSPLLGSDVRGIQREFGVKIVASRYDGKSIVSPPMDAKLVAPATLAVIAQPEDLRSFVSSGDLTVRPKLKDFRYLLARAVAGVAEIVVPPDSSLIGKTVRDLKLRKTYGLGLLSIVRNGEPITHALQTVPFRAGDMLICHTRWEDLARLKNDRDFVIVTADYPRVVRSPYKAAIAGGLLVLSLGLVIFTPVSLPVALLTGAVGMVVSGVLSMDEAYDAVSWPAVFLFVGLLPLGQAVDASGAASYVALHALAALGDLPAIVLQALIAIGAAALALVVSNVGATALLVPIAVDVAFATGANPAMFALTVAISTSNSFVIPTHQVNALILGAGDYRVADFLRVGGLMTLVYLGVSLLALNAIF